MTEYYSYNIIFPTTGSEIKSIRTFEIAPIHFNIGVVSAKASITGEATTLTATGGLVEAINAYLYGISTVECYSNVNNRVNINIETTCTATCDAVVDYPEAL